MGASGKGEPERGDIVVFRPPREPGTDYIKRVIGLPGDKIQMVDGMLHINGKAVPREPAGDWEGEGRFGDRTPVPQYRETLDDGVSYMTLDMMPDGPGDNTRVFEVPPGHYFLMGDNRDNSQDSRFLEGPVGFVPAENLVGRAEIIFFSVDGAPAWAFWKWPWSVRPGRIFDPVMTTRGIDRLQHALGHSFANPDLLARALTHASAVNGREQQTYQRLEFLGDRVLGLVIADMLVERFPDASEGELSRMFPSPGERRDLCCRCGRDRPCEACPHGQRSEEGEGSCDCKRAC